MKFKEWLFAKEHNLTKKEFDILTTSNDLDKLEDFFEKNNINFNTYTTHFYHTFHDQNDILGTYDWQCRICIQDPIYHHSIDLIIFDRKERFGYQGLSSHKYELTIFNAKYIRVITFGGNCLDNIINEFLWWIASD